MMHAEVETKGEAAPKSSACSASSVRVSAFLNSLPRWIAKLRSPFASFVSSMLMPKAEIKKPTSLQNALVWPMPIPFPEVFGWRSPRHALPDAEWKRLVSMQVCVLSWFALGGPSAAPDALRLGSKLSANQWRAVKNLLRFCRDGNTPQLVDAARMGRAAAKFQAAEDVMAALCRAAAALHVEQSSYFVGGCSKPSTTFERPFRCGWPSGFLNKSNVTTAKPLVAERLNFPGPPKFDPCPYFDEGTKEHYLDPLKFAEDFKNYDGLVPKVKIFADRHNVVEVYRKLALSGRLTPLGPEARRGEFFSGLFAVHKDETRDRLVLDARPPNLLEKTQSIWTKTMANPVALTTLRLLPGSLLLCSGEDLRDYFYQFRVTRARASRNILASALTGKEANYVFDCNSYQPQAEVLVGLDSLAMGDSLAVEYAQGSHIGVLLQHEIAKTDQLLLLHHALPRGLMHIGVIVDDLVVLQQILEADLKKLKDAGLPTAGAKAAAAAREAYDKVGLENNPKKGFLDSELASFWGIDVDGRAGVIRCSAHRLWPAMMITMRVATLRMATVGLLEALAGTWVSLLGIRRRLFCLLDIIFEPLGIEDQTVVLRLSDELVDELISLVLLGPMAMVNLRAEYADFLSATDASLTGLAGVKTKISPEFSQELCRYSLRKSTWATLLPPGKSWQKAKGLLDPSEELADGDCYQVHPLWELCARGCKFTKTWSCHVKKAKHINLLEMEAHLREERRLSRKFSSLRYPSALDSQVVLGSVVKGRASSSALTSAMRRSLGYPLGNDLYSFYMFFPSWMNRADGPSRDADPEDPDLELPDWWNEALHGDFRRMDAWLEAHDAPALERVPLELLLGKKNVDIQTQSVLKKKQPDRVWSNNCSAPADCRPEYGRDVDTHTAAVPSGPEQAKGIVLGTEQARAAVVGPVLAVRPVVFAPGPEQASEACEKDDLTAVPVAPGPEQASEACEKGDVTAVPDPKPPRHGKKVDRRKMLLRRLPRQQFFPQTGDLDLSAPGALDLFSGCFGVAKQMARIGFQWILTFELLRSVTEDLLQEELQQTLCELIQLGAFLTVGMAPVCVSFSRAVTPAVRSAALPFGLPGLSWNMQKKVKVGNAIARFCSLLMKLCYELEIGFWCENPDSSFLWSLPDWARFRNADSPDTFRAAFCRFGTPWRKNTRFATNLLLKGHRMLCGCGGRQHQRLRGYSREHQKQWTKLAEPYPRGIALLLAKACGVHAGVIHRDRLNISGCCRSKSLRIGEAENPGPRRPPRNQLRSLEEMPLLMPATIALEKRVLQQFFDWCRTEIHGLSLEELFFKVPALNALLLRCYGDLMYQRNGALSNLRHLLLAAQRWNPMLKPFMQEPWELVARWEKQQPVKHRTPTPEALVKAMCVTAWGLGWRAWTAATAIAFYGGARVGELLKCDRSDLLLPEDLAEEGVGPVFIRLRFFKSRNRTPAQVQHLRIVDDVTCRILRLLFRNVEGHKLLFDTNPYQYRKRWNLLLAAFEIADFKLFTPGGLRGGFAVASYRSGVPIQNIMWAMRLRSQVTLESYLQEAASLSSMASLPKEVRASISDASKVFPFLPFSRC